MALFEFKLKELSEVFPWGVGENMHLHWFGLTDGIYYMNVGEEQLFRSSDEFLKHWRKKHQNIIENDVYVDYQVVRLYEDILEKLVDILQPVPLSLNQVVKTQKMQKDWEALLWNIYESTEDKEIEDLYEIATGWWNYYRSISTMHLHQGPNIWMWTHADTVHIRWINESCSIDGIQPWSTVQGEFILTVEEFKTEVESFHERLMEQMSHRIQLIKNNNPIPHIKIDIQSLENEHEERQQTLIKALEATPNIKSWDRVIEAIEKLKKGLTNH